MKSIVRIFISLAVVLCLSVSAVSAATPDGKQKQPRREKIAERQAARIASELALDSVRAQRFVTTFVQCQREKWALKGRTQRGAQLTEAQTDSLLRAQFVHSQKILDLRRKYYGEYRKFLTAKQVERVYQIEQRQGRALEHHKARRPRKDSRRR